MNDFYKNLRKQNFAVAKREIAEKIASWGSNNLEKLFLECGSILRKNHAASYFAEESGIPYHQLFDVHHHARSYETVESFFDEFGYDIKVVKRK